MIHHHNCGHDHNFLLSFHRYQLTLIFNMIMIIDHHYHHDHHDHRAHHDHECDHHNFHRDLLTLVFIAVLISMMIVSIWRLWWFFMIVSIWWLWVFDDRDDFLWFSSSFPFNQLCNMHHHIGTPPSLVIGLNRNHQRYKFPKMVIRRIIYIIIIKFVTAKVTLTSPLSLFNIANFNFNFNFHFHCSQG